MREREREYVKGDGTIVVNLWWPCLAYFTVAMYRVCSIWSPATLNCMQGLTSS